MTPFDWSRYAVGGAASRPDSFTGLQPQFASAVQQMLMAAEQELGPKALTITSAYRSPELQGQLYQNAIKKYGSEKAARKWVAPPGKSRHNSGTAVDFADPRGGLLRDANSREAQWIKANAGRFGLAVPMSWEPWQVELAGDRGGSTQASGGQPMAAQGTREPIMSTQGQMPAMPPQEPERRGLFNPDVRDRLIIALEGMTLNPNQALMQQAGQGIQDRRAERKDTKAKNRTAEWLRSQGRDDLAAAVESGAIDGRTAAGVLYAQPADDRTAGLKEYEAAVAQGFQGSFLDYKTALAQAGRSETNVNVGAGETAFDKKTGEVLATEAAEIVQQGSQAQRSLGQIATLENALQNSPSGALGSLANVAANLGIKTEGSSNIEVANAIISQLVPQQRPPGSGVMSDADLELFKQSLPRLINTREGNQKIVDTMRAIAQYDVSRAKIARQLQLGQISQEEAFNAYNSLGNPVADFLSGPPAVSSGNTDDDALFKKYGISR